MECCQSRSVEETSRAEEEEEKVESRLRWSSIFGVSRARNRWTKWFPVSFTFAWNLCVWACLQLAVGGRAMCSARAWRERRQCTFPAESFRRESSAHRAREWVRSFPSVECCSTGSISATIPEAPRLLLLNGYSCFWKDPLPYENERCNKWWIKTRHLLSFYFGFLENVWHFEIRRLWNWIRTIFIAMRCYIFVSYHKLKYGYFLKIKNYLARKIMHL